jgi:hypothetical protein
MSDADIQQLQADNDKLKHELSTLRIERESERIKQEAELAAAFKFGEAQAGIAAGCDFIFPACPDSVTSRGREAQAGGFGGGASYQFLLLVFAKLFALAGAIGFLLGGFAVGKNWLEVQVKLRDKSKQLDDADKKLCELRTLDAKRFELEEQAESALLAAASSKEARAQAERELSALNAQIAKQKAELDLLIAETAEQVEMQKLLRDSYA